MMRQSQEPTSLWIPSTSICGNWMFTMNLEINSSARSIFLSLDILIPRISLLSSPIATQSYINSEHGFSL